MTHQLPDFIQKNPLPLPPKSRIVVAMSGGVDSSTVAALCHALGYETIGITLQLYDMPQAEASQKACCAGVDIHDAKKTADNIGFPHYTLNYQSQFKQSVIDNFADSYLRGETPVPCITCNQTVKFTDLLKVAKDLSAEALVTGHYVRKHIINGKSQLLTAADAHKDQSYFLFATTQQQLDFLHFPLGDLQKSQTRELARHFNLPTAEKPESQDICFVGSGGYSNLIKKLRPSANKSGDIIDIASGEVIGKHQGITDYTVGQRKGLGIGGRDNDNKPLYVIAINVDKNQVIVGEYQYLAIRQVQLHNINWLGDGDADNIHDLQLKIKFRSGMKPIEASITALPNNNLANSKSSNNTIELSFAEDQYGVSAGQPCVFYQGNRVLGGGFIKQTINAYYNSNQNTLLEATA